MQGCLRLLPVHQDLRGCSTPCQFGIAHSLALGEVQSYRVLLTCASEAAIHLTGRSAGHDRREMLEQSQVSHVRIPYDLDQILPHKQSRTRATS